MFKVLILFAVFSAIAANSIPKPPSSGQPQAAVPLPALMRRARAAEMPMEPKKEPSAEGAAESADDMEKAETFGFGFHKHIYISPSYGYGGYYPYSYGYVYPSYGYGGYGYPYYY